MESECFLPIRTVGFHNGIRIDQGYILSSGIATMIVGCDTATLYKVSRMFQADIAVQGV
jgi:hypothetical protein